jgi:hypothetical protein
VVNNYPPPPADFVFCRRAHFQKAYNPYNAYKNYKLYKTYKALQCIFATLPAGSA